MSLLNHLPDLINGTFEAGGAIVNLANIRALRRDKEVKGVDWRVYVWFASWGIFNLYYYPHLGQWLSFAGGAAIVSVNVTWVALALYYMRQHNEKAR